MANYVVKLYRDGQVTTDRIRAEAAADRLSVPNRVAAVYANASGGAPYFSTVAEAITWAQSLTPSLSAPVLIKSYTDANNAPYTLPSGQDYYTLFDAGIKFDSEYDTWKNFILSGGDLELSELLYDVKLERTKIEVKL